MKEDYTSVEQALIAAGYMLDWTAPIPRSQYHIEAWMRGEETILLKVHAWNISVVVQCFVEFNPITAPLVAVIGDGGI